MRPIGAPRGATPHLRIVPVPGDCYLDSFSAQAADGVSGAAVIDPA